MTFNLMSFCSVNIFIFLNLYLPSSASVDLGSQEREDTNNLLGFEGLLNQETPFFSNVDESMLQVNEDVLPSFLFFFSCDSPLSLCVLG